MIQIGLLILKIIGWTVLGIFGLLAGILLLVLLVPIRYHFAVSRHESFQGMLQVSWLLHMFSAVISYEDEFQVHIRVFGRRLFREEEPGHEAEKDLEDGIRETLERTEQVIEEPNMQKDPDMEWSRRWEDPARSEQGIQPESGETQKYTQDKTSKKKAAQQSGKIVSPFAKWKQKFSNIRNKWMNIREFFGDEENQATLKLIWRQIRKILHHLRPVKIRGTVTFGFDDPYTTGQVLTAAAMGYGWYGKWVQITPCFEEEILEGDLQGNGRICLGILLYHAVRILPDRNFRKLLKQWRGKGGIQYG